MCQMKKTAMRWIALMLALVMCVGVLPVAALAEGEEEPAAVNEPAEQTRRHGIRKAGDMPAEDDILGKNI